MSAKCVVNLGGNATAVKPQDEYKKENKMDFQGYRCNKCGQICFSGYNFCPHCGTKLPEYKPKKKQCPMCQGTGEVIDWGGPMFNDVMTNKGE